MNTEDVSQEKNSVQPKTGLLQFIRSNVVAIAIVIALLAGYFLLRTTPSDLSSIEELQAIMNGGKPVLIEFYSNT